MITHYRQLDSNRASRLIERFGNWLLLDGELLKGIFRYPTAEQVMLREGVSAGGKTMRSLMRYPELLLHRASGAFRAGQTLRVLCRPETPDFLLGEFEYGESALYRITLTEAQAAPTDTAGRKWR
jgi:hypothetical protein